ncbi:uncharacterized protein BP5553_10044 [Venustampulla echinocandica]|uniref:Aminoglycoside phosphotransferase domain-containing protein n=1 Tax=Venustampulla echinocandica TaxID=2656787 RepID=A0A370TA65_9HELO|nr:uncharacterized protein BP5553_10044 [Venustampulla echinocandica]RDL30699.1 hypothetical protein BP5553_10044 [Venustampulla echinocandica]
MAQVLQPYSTRVFNTLPELHMAQDSFMIKGGKGLVDNVFKPMIEKHGLEAKLGVGLLHRHFDLEGSEKLVEFNNISLPWNSDREDSHNGGKVLPSAWVVRNGGLIPYEYYFSPLGRCGRVRGRTDNMPSLFPHIGFTCALEVTEGRANINLSPDQVAEGGWEDSTETMWFFEPEYMSTSLMDSEMDVLSKVNKTALLRRATSLANGLECDFVGDPIMRDDQAILRINFPSEGKSWAAKIPFEQQWPFYEISVRPLEFIARNHPRIPAPRVHDYVDAGAEQENPVEVAYILMDWMDGSHMQPWSLSEPSISARHRVLEQIADIMLEMLSNKPIDGGIYLYGVPDGTPKNTPVSTVVWLTESIDRALRRHLRQKKTSIVIDNLIQRSMVAQYVVPEHNTSYWAAIHPDLHSTNIIADKDWKITGLIDWNLMSAQPLQKWAVFPKLIDHIPGAAPPDLPAEYTYLNLAQDKAYFVAVLAEKERKNTSKMDVAKLVESSTERTFFEMSHNALTVHRKFAERFCKRAKANVEGARRELELFLAKNPGISRDDAGVVDVEKELDRLLANIAKD